MGWKKDGIVPDRHYEDPSRGSFALHLDVPLFLDFVSCVCHHYSLLQWYIHHQPTHD